MYTLFQKICIWIRQEHSRFSRGTLNFLVAFLRFCFRKTTVKSKFLEFYLLLRHPLVATFNETREPTSRKYVVQWGIVMPLLSEKLQFLWSHSSVFPLEEEPKYVNFREISRVFLPLKYPFVANFKETCGLTFRKHVSEPGKSIPDLALLPFCFRKTTSKSKFSEFFNSKTPFRGCFQGGNTCTYFQKICSWTRYSNDKFIRENSKEIKNLLEIKKLWKFRFSDYLSKAKTEECDQKDRSFCHKFGMFMACSDVYFLEVRTHVAMKVVTNNSFRYKKNYENLDF